MAMGTQPQRGTASNHYDLLARLAGGGMAEIFLARANGLEGFERYVVLKRIRSERTDDAMFVGMFLDEARLVAQLQHPNIAQVFDLGRIGDDYFYTMEFVHGRDVLEVLARHDELGTRMPLSVVLSVVVGAAAGLAHAHDRNGADGRPLNIVHRDVSPSNLMVSFEGTVKVLDFGIAKARFRRTETQAGTLMGKLAYLSPEQCKTGIVDRRSDIFALGIVFWEMVTNERAFKREADFDTLRAVVKDMPAPPSTIVPGLPKGVDAIIMRCLEKDPDDRYQSVAELIDDVEALAETAGISLTAGVLRRHMKDLFGTRPEPWQTLEGDIGGLPLDIEADEVPLLPATGLIDVSVLLSRAELAPPPVPPRLPRKLLRDEDPPTPLRIPTGSVPMVPIEVLLDRLSEPTVARGALPSDLTGQLVVSPPVPIAMAMAPIPRPRRRVGVIALIAVATIALALVIYVALGRNAEPPHVAAPAPSPPPVAAPRPTATPIEVPAAAAVVVPVEPEKPAAAPAKPRPAPPIPTKHDDVKRPAVEANKATVPKPEPVKPDPQPETKPAKPECDDPMRCQFY
jgi:serine/threonine protein kinase